MHRQQLRLGGEEGVGGGAHRRQCRGGRCCQPRIAAGLLRALLLLLLLLLDVLLPALLHLLLLRGLSGVALWSATCGHRLQAAATAEHCSCRRPHRSSTAVTPTRHS